MVLQAVEPRFSGMLPQGSCCGENGLGRRKGRSPAEHGDADGRRGNRRMSVRLQSSRGARIHRSCGELIRRPPGTRARSAGFAGLKHGSHANAWLPRKDSNLDKQIQNLSCYRYTTRQSGVPLFSPFSSGFKQKQGHERLSHFKSFPRPPNARGGAYKPDPEDPGPAPRHRRRGRNRTHAGGPSPCSPATPGRSG